MNEWPFIHLGFPKCASTFLQKKIFSNLKTIKMVGGTHSKVDADQETIKKETRYILGSREFDELPKDLLFFSKGCQRYLYSHENLLGHVRPYTESYHYSERENCINNLVRIFRDYGEFLIVIRRQDSISESFYNFFSNSHSGRPGNMFIDFPGSAIAPGTIKLKDNLGLLYLESFDYNRVINRIEATIPRNRIHVLIFEELFQNPDLFLEKLGRVFEENLTGFIDSNQKKVNPSTKRKQVPIILNSLSREWIKKIPVPIKDKIRPLFSDAVFSYEVKELILNYYKKGNLSLSKKYGLNLERYGYF